MRRILICSGVLGVGTALVFAAAALTATLFPNGTLVSSGWNGPVFEKGWGVAMPAPAPEFDVAPAPGFRALPGDTVGGAVDGIVEVTPAP
jgi:hypothetical protein